MLNRKEILRYLGAENSGNALNHMIERAEREIIAASHPKHVYKLINVEIENKSLILGHVTIESKDLAQHLQGCREAFLFAITLGPNVDSLIKRYTYTEMSMLPVLQAVASTYIEHCANMAQKELEKYAVHHSSFLRPRFSPGYGDFPLHYQRLLFNILDISKKIGVSLTESYLMIPSKSITAVIGLSDDPSQCHINRCMNCNNKSCPFRKDELCNE